ncbi:TPA: hypothetical protein ACGVAR_001067 [Vibrio vulnificus]|nr:hypothetical protein [Vibrio vulnificus]HDY7749617.1 hypothetical protein [Vibrio vulnificus]HDY7758974.1 hypothetical protein [Vibrio vulnificus]HDY7763612.1 hypothetical protein [Vibrio vulnificus]HDY7772780.1 hypothetical protein [Vibrio vulnificus]
MYTQKLPIFPSQLADFKVKAKQFSSIIENITGCKRISSFNRNDWLAVAIGYKGHSDLVQTSKQRTLTDRSSQLVIFSKSHYFSSKIKSTFASQLSATQAEIELAVTKMGQIERKELLLSGQLAERAALLINQIKNDNPNSIFLFDSGSKANAAPISASYAIKSFKNLPKGLCQSITAQNARTTDIYYCQRGPAENLSMSGLLCNNCVNTVKHSVT